jgi:hypothetical protein
MTLPANSSASRCVIPACCEEIYVFPSRTDQKVARVAGVAQRGLGSSRATRATRGTFQPLGRVDDLDSASMKHRRLVRAVRFMKLKGHVAMSNPLPFIIPALIIIALLLVISISLDDK